ncbi:hypothetical protein, partial [Planktothrix prolifica]|uniref:hypothetical protein n=1 Tax=Planktothrix prolifica TaxID=54307 RepID=UPI001ED98BE6
MNKCTGIAPFLLGAITLYLEDAIVLIFFIPRFQNNLPSFWIFSGSMKKPNDLYSFLFYSVNDKIRC